VLRFLIINNQPNRHIVFDTGIGLLNLVDEFDKEERVFFGKEEETKGMKDLNVTYKLAQPYDIPDRIPFQLPYRHLVTLIQLGETWDEVKKILLRTDQIPKDISKTDERHLKQRVEHARYWLDNFAPDMVKFEIKKKMPNVDIDKKSKDFLSNLNDTLENITWDPESIHRTIYETSEDLNIPIKTAFKTIYLITLGQEKGPRAGYFLSNLDKDFVLKRIEQAIK